MEGFHVADGSGLAAQHQGVGDGVSGGIAHAVEEVAAGDARCCKEAVVGVHQAISGHDFAQIVAGIQDPLLFRVGLRIQAGLNLAVHALESAGSDGAFGVRAGKEHVRTRAWKHPHARGEELRGTRARPGS